MGSLQWRQTLRLSDRISITYAVQSETISVGDLDVWVERALEAGAGGGAAQQKALRAELVVEDTKLGIELARTPLDGPCNWGDLEARWSAAKRTLTVVVQLLPAGAADPLLDAPANEDGAPNGQHAAAAAASEHGSTEGCESLASAVEELPEEEEGEREQEGRQGEAPPEAAEQQGPGAPAAASSPNDAEPEGGEAAQAAPAPVTPQLSGDGEGGALAAADGGEEAASSAAASKKKKKKKKKKAGAGAAAAGAAGEGEQPESGEVGEGEGGGEAAEQPRSEVVEEYAAAEQQQQQQQQVAEEAPHETSAPGGQQNQQEEEQEAAAAAAAEATEAQEALAASQEPPEAVPRGVTQLGRELPHRPLGGPHVRDALSKDRNKDKGEDQWLLKPHSSWGLEGMEGEVSFSAVGVFDGHGGRQVATFTSNSLLKNVMAEVDAGGAPLQDVPGVEGLGEQDAAEWRLQATLLKRLPQACVGGFMRTNEEAQRRFPHGGATATLAVAVGWELIVASVGDSCAYLDTGAEVLQVSGNHRLEDNPAEVQRIKDSGGEVATSTVDGKPAGPIRVWPGGLAMARSIGDLDAGDRVTAEPEVCQVTIPATGARLIMGSDGLWDAVHHKSAAHHCREMGAAEAAHRLLALAVRNHKLKDDVTVVILDFLPSAGNKLPPGFSVHRATSAGKKSSADAGRPALAHVWHPLREQYDSLAAGAQRRLGVLREQQEAEEEAAELARREAERQSQNFELLLKKAARGGATTAESLDGYGSELHKELATLRIPPEQLQAMLQQKSAEVEEEKRAAQREASQGEWATVGDGEPQQAQHAEGRKGRQPPRQQQQQPGRGRRPVSGQQEHAPAAGRQEAAAAAPAEGSADEWQEGQQQPGVAAGRAVPRGGRGRYGPAGRDWQPRGGGGAYDRGRGRYEGAPAYPAYGRGGRGGYGGEAGAGASLEPAAGAEQQAPAGPQVVVVVQAEAPPHHPRSMPARQPGGPSREPYREAQGYGGYSGRGRGRGRGGPPPDHYRSAPPAASSAGEYDNGFAPSSGGDPGQGPPPGFEGRRGGRYAGGRGRGRAYPNRQHEPNGSSAAPQPQGPPQATTSAPPATPPAPPSAPAGAAPAPLPASAPADSAAAPAGRGGRGRGPGGRGAVPGRGYPRGRATGRSTVRAPAPPAPHPQPQ